jgi:hypothetical protein
MFREDHNNYFNGNWQDVDSLGDYKREVYYNQLSLGVSTTCVVC